jgi:tetratricopeptide (TPR) repeat protein
VRPTETAGFNDAWRSMDRKTMTLPPEAQERRKKARDIYIAAIKDWARNGPQSAFVYDAAEAKRRMKLPDETVAIANANFRLGRWLFLAGRKDEAEPFLKEAIRLRPESWNFYRQAADLEQVGKASGPEFIARVQALGAKKYYEPADMPGMPD